MQRQARHLTLAAATLLFVVVAGLTLAWANGWRLMGGQVRRSAGIFIDSQPRANIFLNGKYAGLTPFRTANLFDRQVTVTVQRDGYLPWSQSISLTPGVAVSIAPLYLWPVVEPVAVEPVGQQSFFSDHLLTGLWSATAQADGRYTVSAKGVPGYASPLTVPFAPTAVSLSPDRNHLYVRNAETAGILSHHRDWWPVAVVDQPHWSPDGADVLFGLHAGQLVRFDILTHSVTSDMAATSLATDSSGVWATATAEAGTDVWRLDPANLARRRLIFRRPDALTFAPGPRGWLLLRQLSDQRSFVVRAVPGGHRLAELGPIDRLVSAQANQPLAWLTGPDLFIRIGDRTTLVDRFGGGVIWIGWLHAPEAVTVFHGHNVTLYEQLEDRQWHRLAVQSVPANAVFLGGTSGGDGFWYQLDDQIYFWSWRS